MAQRSSSKSSQSKSGPEKSSKDTANTRGRILDEPEVLSPFRVLFLGTVLLATGALGFYTLPGMLVDDAKGSRLVNSIYCSAITLTTIGYGDICPGNLEPISKLFIVLFALSGLGFFCGPLLEVTSSWTNHVPGGLATLSSLTIGFGVALFSNMEGVSQLEAVYASVITGTTIGYGDYTPKSDLGKLAVAAYAVMVVNVVAGLLKPGRMYLEDLCRVKRNITVTNKPLPMTSADSKTSAFVKED